MVCDRVGILAGGKIIKVASVAEILQQSVEWVEVQVDQLQAETARSLRVGEVSRHGDKMVVRVPGCGEVNGAIARLMAAGGRIAAVVPVRRTLEDYFLNQLAGAGHRVTAPEARPAVPSGRQASSAGPATGDGRETESTLLEEKAERR